MEKDLPEPRIVGLDHVQYHRAPRRRGGGAALLL